jgi:hypothetical protein
MFFASGLSPYNDAFLTYYAKRTKNLKIQVIWDLGRGNPATLGSKNRTYNVATPLVLTWRIQLFVTVRYLVWGGAIGPSTWQPLAQNFNVSFNLSKSKYIPITNVQLGRKHKQYLTIIVSIQPVSRPCNNCGGGGREKGYTVSRPGHIWLELPGSMWLEAVRWHGKTGPWLLGLNERLQSKRNDYVRIINKYRQFWSYQFVPPYPVIPHPPPHATSSTVSVDLVSLTATVSWGGGAD